MNEFNNDWPPQLTDIQEGLRDVIMYHEELGDILRNLQEEIDTILDKASPTTHATKNALRTAFRQYRYFC